MKTTKKALCILLAVLSILSCCSVMSFAESKSYVIKNPYQDVIWEGEGAYGAYKGNLHTHSFVSDAQVDYRDMILEYYNQGFDFLAMTDHAVTGKPWNQKPTMLPLYLYQLIIGNKVHYFTDEEYEAIQNGTFKVNGVERGYGMVDVYGGNELNGLTLTKDHVNGMFLPEGVGDNYLGFENDHEGAVKLVDDAGGLSFINHPGDWMQSNSDRANCSKPENIQYFGNILLKYDSCLGIEVFNEHNGPTGYDRDTWDNLLMYCLPYGKDVIGFSNGDTHYLRDVDSSFSVFMMKENTLENIKKTMQTGAFFAVTKAIRKDELIHGPEEDLDARIDLDNPDDKGRIEPRFTNIVVDGHKITVTFNRTYDLRWVANGKVIAKANYDKVDNALENTQTYTIDLDEIENSDEFLYVRCQLIGEGGVTLTQAFVIDDGTEKPEYVEDTSFKAVAKEALRKFLSLRIFVLIKIIYDAIAG